MFAELGQCHHAALVWCPNAWGVACSDINPSTHARARALPRWYIWETPIFVLMGCAGGLFGVLFVRLNLIVMALRKRFVPPTDPIRRLAEVVFIAFVTATTVFTLTYVSPCRDKPAYLAPGANCTDPFETLDKEAFTIDTDIASEYFPS